MSVPEALQPGRTGLGVGGCTGDDRYKVVDRTVDRGPDGPRGAVDPLEGRRQALEQADRTVGRERRLTAGDLLDLAHRLLHPLDGGLRPPAERRSPEACLEFPGVGVSVDHAVLPGRERYTTSPWRRALIRCPWDLVPACQVFAILHREAASGTMESTVVITGGEFTVPARQEFLAS